MSMDEEELEEESFVSTWQVNDEEPVESDEEDDLPDDEPVFPLFNPKWQKAFEGLAYLGYLEAKVEIPYHTFTVRTLTVGEKIKIAEMIKELEGSLGYARAYRAAVAAAGTVLVDGQPLLVGSRKIDSIAQKYQYMIDNWHDFVIDILYEKINELEGQVLKVLEELGIFNADKQTVAQTGPAQVAKIDGLD